MEAGVLFGTLLLFMAARIPMFLALVASTIVMVLVVPVMPKTVLVQRLLVGIEQPAIAAILYFFLLGSIMNVAGLTERILVFARASFGGMRGALAQVNIGASMLFGGMSGSATADVSAIGSIMIPAMKADGYSPQYAAAITATSASIGLLIPPSIPMVLFGLFNNVSIGSLFVAGMVPGFLVAAVLMVYSHWHAGRYGAPQGKRVSLREWWVSLCGCFWILLLPVIVFISISFGIATITEVGAIAVAYALIISAFVYRQLTWKKLASGLMSSARDSGQILSLIVVAGGFLWIMASLGTMSDLAAWISSLELRPTVLLFSIAITILVLGTVVGPGLQMILLIPVLYPVVIAAGVDALHFGVVTVLAGALGLFTPPIGFIVLLTSAQAGVSPNGVYRACFPLLLVLGSLLVVLILVPSISTFLPQLMFDN